MRQSKKSRSRSARQTSLEAGQTRLFRLHAARNTSDNEAGSDPIRGDFIIVNIHENDGNDDVKEADSAAPTPTQTYECLSYVWGDSLDLKIVNLDGEDVRITQNLYVALLHLRASMPKAEGKKLRNGSTISAQSSYRTLWIDALCINQENLDERSQQVGCMGSIYKSSERVIAFLGEAWDGHEMVFELLELAAEEPERHITVSNKPYLQARGHDTSSPIFVNNLMRLFQAKWFSRVWVVQEFVNAKQVFFQLGHTIVDARRLHDGFLTIRRHIWSGCCGVQPWLSEPHSVINNNVSHSSKDPETIMTNVFLVVGWYEDLSDLRWNRGSLPALDNLSIFRRGGCTDTRDRVYASFGLPLPDNATWGMPVDYTISANLVFTNVTFALITFMQNLDILSHIILQPQKCAFSPELLKDDSSNSKVVPESLASYVVDWSAPMTDSVYAQYRSRMVAVLGGHDHACRHTTASFVPFNHSKMGVVAMTQGIILDRIDAIGATAAPDDIITDVESTASQIRNIVLEAREMVGLPVYAGDQTSDGPRLFMPPHYAEASDVEIDLWRTLCGNRGTSDDLEDQVAWRPAEVEVDYDLYVQWWRAMILGYNHSESDGLTVPSSKRKRTSSSSSHDFEERPDAIYVGGMHGSTGLARSSTGLPLPGLGVDGFEGAFASNIAARRFFRTDDGKIGFGPRDARPGDLVVLMAGGKVPYVLRRHEVIGEDGRCCCEMDEGRQHSQEAVVRMKKETEEDRDEGEGVFYTFVGDVYVDGNMNGDGDDDGLVWKTMLLK